jgi:hypothetical protein
LEGYIATADFKLKFNPTDCGTQSDNADSNWCTIAMVEKMGADDQTQRCTGNAGNECETGTLSLTAGALALETGICNMKDRENIYFFKNSVSGNCGVTVTDISGIHDDGNDKSRYLLAYEITVHTLTDAGNVADSTADLMQGKLPAFEITYSAFAQTLTSVTGYINQSGASDVDFDSCYPACGPGNADTITLDAGRGGGTYQMEVGNTQSIGTSTTMSVFISEQGNQPDGTFDLTYKCESDVSTVPVINAYSNSAGSTSLTVGSAFWNLYDIVYLTDGSVSSYHKITAVSGGDTIATIEPAWAGAAGPTSGEMGVFYSDPYNEFGVSEACLASREYTTSPISPFDSAADIKTKLKALSDVIVDVNTERNFYDVGTTASPINKVGYTWTVTFYKNHGDLNEMVLGSTNLLMTSSSGSKVNAVSTPTAG